MKLYPSLSIPALLLQTRLERLFSCSDPPAVVRRRPSIVNIEVTPPPPETPYRALWRFMQDFRAKCPMQWTWIESDIQKLAKKECGAYHAGQEVKNVIWSVIHDPSLEVVSALEVLEIPDDIWERLVQDLSWYLPRGVDFFARPSQWPAESPINIYK